MNRKEQDMDKTRNKIIAENIRKYLKEHNMSQKTLAESIGIAPSTLSDYLNLRSNPSHGVIQKIADYFKVGKSDIDTTYKDKAETNITHIYNQLTPPRQTKVYNFAEHQLEQQNNKVVPLVGATAANPQALEYADTINDISINTDVPNNADCALVVRGNSMETDYTDGSIVFYKRQNSVENGELAIVEIDGDGVTFKKVIFDYENQQLILRSLNPEYPDRILKDNEYRIIGKVVK